MLECNSTSKMIYQPIGKGQCCEPRNSGKNSQASAVSRWQQMVKDFLAYGGADARKPDKHEPVLLGGGSYMFVRCESESVFREGK